jgi:hypothetical protein
LSPAVTAKGAVTVVSHGKKFDPAINVVRHDAVFDPAIRFFPRISTCPEVSGRKGR